MFLSPSPSLTQIYLAERKSISRNKHKSILSFSHSGSISNRDTCMPWLVIGTWKSFVALRTEREGGLLFEPTSCFPTVLLPCGCGGGGPDCELLVYPDGDFVALQDLKMGGNFLGERKGYIWRWEEGFGITVTVDWIAGPVRCLRRRSWLWLRLGWERKIRSEGWGIWEGGDCLIWRWDR